MARISTYAIDGTPTVNDKVIGTDVDNLDVTMNYTIGDIIALVPGGTSSVQSLNSLTGDLTLVGAGGNTVTVSGTTITITGTSGSGGITSINTTATGPNVNLEGKGGLIVTEVGNTIFLDTASVGGLVTSLTTLGTSGASTLTDGVLNIPDYATGGGGGTPGTPINGIQVNVGSSFGAYDYLISNPISNTLDLGNGSIGKAGNVAGIVNLFNATGDQNIFGSVRFYDFLQNTTYVGIIGPGSMEGVPSYDIALPGTEPAKGQVMSVKQNQVATPWELEWTSPSGGGGGGTVTDVSVLVNGGVTDAIDLRVFNSTTTPRIELDFNGVAGQYINGLGVLTTSDFMTTLTTNGTSGAASYDAPTNTLNIPTIAGGVALPYFSYEAMWSSTLGVVTVTVLNNTTSRTFNWTDNLNGTITVSASATMPTGILVLLNGYGTNKDVPVQSFYGGYARNLDITIDILNNQFIQTNADIASGNFELRLYG
tara:strand:+ start:512 stop:1954 length:1443 start_codon:yes stop_codon:yes gene_type:complete